MRSMGHPEYRYKPWTDERRQRASERAKAQYAARCRPDAASPREERIVDAFVRMRADQQREFLKAWFNLIVLYRESPSDPEFMRMLADVWEDMAKAIASDMRRP